MKILGLGLINLGWWHKGHSERAVTLGNMDFEEFEEKYGIFIYFLLLFYTDVSGTNG